MKQKKYTIIEGFSGAVGMGDSLAIPTDFYVDMSMGIEILSPRQPCNLSLAK